LQTEAGLAEAAVVLEAERKRRLLMKVRKTKLLAAQVSISQTFYKKLFCTKVFCAAFLLLQFGYVIFWQKTIGSKSVFLNVGVIDFRFLPISPIYDRPLYSNEQKKFSVECQRVR